MNNLIFIIMCCMFIYAGINYLLSTKYLKCKIEIGVGILTLSFLQSCMIIFQMYYFMHFVIEIVILLFIFILNPNPPKVQNVYIYIYAFLNFIVFFSIIRFIIVQ
jgi:hypothetical protein